jgi:flagellar motor switch protein FliN/FliY
MTMIDSGTVGTGFGEALAETVSALIEQKTAVRIIETAPDQGYVITIEARWGGRGALHAHFDRAQATALAKRIAGTDTEPEQSAVLASLKEICGQAATTLAGRYPGGGSQLEVTSAQVWVDAAHWASATMLEIAGEDGTPVLRLALACMLELAMDQARPVEEPEGSPFESPNLNVILDIDLPLVVRFGRTEMTLKELTALGPGSLINLGRSPDEPVDVLVSHQIVAKGEVVAVAGSYGVRIRDVVSPVERVRSLGVEL